MQLQSSDARMGRGSTNEENWIDIETLMPAQDIGRLPETINDKRGGQIKHRHGDVHDDYKDKAEENNFGGGQRGLGFGNEGYTNVQGSGQNHTISEIPPEMEVIVHDVKDIKESKKEGYSTEAGNVKAGDPSRATDDDDSLLSQTYAKKDFVGDLLSPKKHKQDDDIDDSYADSLLDDDDESTSSNTAATNFDEPWFT